ncbi:MAG: phytoene desaturase family protein, partial [Acidimicrobiales bacterium]
MPDVVVVGAGPNGLAAALTCAKAGRSVLVLEAMDTIGGGARTAELTLPGFAHDVCSAIHPLAAVSPFFASAGLDRYGLELLHTDVALAHPLDGGRAGVLHRDVAQTVTGLGVDGKAWDRHIGWAARRWDALGDATLGPLLRVPRHPLTLAGFGVRGVLPTTWAGRAFRTDEAKGLFAGASAHAFLPLSRPLTTSMGIMLLASAHVAGWPVARGGSQAIVDAMAAQLVELGGQIETGRLVQSLADVPDSAAVLFDVTPRQLLAICGDELPAGYRRRLGHFRYGPGVFKVDYALSEPMPWTNADCRQAGALHVGGTLADIAEAEAAVGAGRHPDRPFVLVGQQSLAD